MKVRAVLGGLSREVMFEQRPARKKNTKCEAVTGIQARDSRPEMSHSVSEEVREARVTTRGLSEGRVMEMRSGQSAGPRL